MSKLLRNLMLQIVTLGFVLAVLLLHSKLKFTTKILTEDNNHFRKYVESSLSRNETSLTPFNLKLNWIIEPRINLSTREELLVLVLVTSSITNFKKRRMIRETWGDSKHFKNTRLKTLFLLGKTSNSTQQELIQSESANNKDILQTAYIDSYRNLTYKITSGLTWAMEHGKNISFFAKIDDDMLVNPFQMRSFLEKALKANKGTPTNSIYGRLRKLAKPFRKGKYKVTVKEFPYKLYPPHILGSAYILGREALFNIVTHMKNSQFLYLEDVFITGLVAKKSRVSLRNIEREHFVTKINALFIRGKRFMCVGCDLTKAMDTWKKITSSYKMRGY